MQVILKGDFFYIKMLLVYWCLLLVFCQVSIAEDKKEKLPVKAVTGQQRIFINPETGERISAPDPTTIAAAAQTTEIEAAPQETIIYQDDGSVRVDLNGKYMMPVYGRVNPDGSLSLSHDPSPKEK
ncbi:MAG: hypothetical protein D3923_04735 [Candidatus Electrothrix sp. AR3]|nr:hypothetical protein [Candidatus Electrothrix sp. AR3]